jgi:hypothetical protein
MSRGKRRFPLTSGIDGLPELPEFMDQLPGRPGKILRHLIEPPAVQESSIQFVPKGNCLAQVDRIEQGLLRKSQVVL